jgi:CPA2 family monovalent cation:H+ antiporter-2
LLLAQQAQPNTAVDLVVVLATAGLIALLFSRVRLPTIPGYLIAGALIGPYALGLIRSVEAVSEISRLATILLMFTIGLELDLARVKKGLFSIVGGTLLATGLCLLLAFGVAFAFLRDAIPALVIAMGISCAATVAPLRIMEQRRELNTTYGRLAFGITLFQDLIAVAMLALLPVLVAWRGGMAQQTAPEDALRAGAFAIAGIAALIVFGRYGLPKVLGEASRHGGEVLIVISAAVALASALFTAWLGFSPEMGAFLAGLLLASTPFRYQVAGQLVPVRDLFLAVFFTAVGLMLPIGDVAREWWVALIAVGALVLVKIVGIGVASWSLGASARIGMLAAAVLVPAGEFTLVIVSQAREKGLLDPRQVGHCVAVVVISTLLSPLIAGVGRRLAGRLQRVPNAPWARGSAFQEDPAEAAARDDAQRTGFHVIIAGFGPVGRAVADAIQPEGVEISVIELNPNTVQRQSVLGRRIVYGDASNPDVLLSAGLETANAVILTMPDEEAMLRACRTVRSLKKDVFLAARANALSKGLMAMQLGADHAVVEEMATAEAMGKEVLLKIKDRMAGTDTGPRLYEYQQ